MDTNQNTGLLMDAVKGNQAAITDEKQLALYVKDTMESEEGVIFTKWYSTMCRLGIPIEWEDMI